MSRFTRAGGRVRGIDLRSKAPTYAPPKPVRQAPPPRPAPTPRPQQQQAVQAPQSQVQAPPPQQQFTAPQAPPPQVEAPQQSPAMQGLMSAGAPAAPIEPSIFNIGEPSQANPLLGQRSPALTNLLLAMQRPRNY